MKAQTIIHFVQGKPIRVSQSADFVTAQLLAERPFSATRITDHGSEKQVVLRAGSILRLEQI